MDHSFHNTLGRMDWGFGNPNKTAALIALVMIAVWIIGYLRKWAFWPALLLFVGFGACLLCTQSRGGVVGVLVGSLFVLFWAPRPYSFPRVLAVVGVCVALIIFAFLIKADARYDKGLSGKDLSIQNRLLIWEQVPSMIHDAPQGWGVGKSGDAYMQWYQPIGRGEGYRTLVNSHLTWLSELDWPGRIVYIFLWVSAFILLWPNANQRWFSIPLGIWVAFGICASFSSVAEAKQLWILPALAFGSVLVARYRSVTWPSENVWLRGAMASILILVTIGIGGELMGWTSVIHCPSPSITILGKASPKIWIVAPNRSILGEHYGQEVRRGYEENTFLQHQGVGVCVHWENVPPNQILVLSSPISQSLESLHSTQIILINPNPVSAGELQELTDQNVTVVVGQFSRNKEYWDQESLTHPSIKIQTVAGSAEYIPNWMHEIGDAIKVNLGVSSIK